MATTTIPWGDGSGDNIYFTYSASTGDQTVLVSSDANGGAARQKVITFVSTVGNISRSLTVLQESGMDLVSITWNDVCITYNDTAIAYPYTEEYIVFVDSTVEQICATKWGDGTGIKPSQAAQVTNAQFGLTFRNNTEITSFNELSYFTDLTTFQNGAFQGCSALTEITIPAGIQNNATAIANLFANCTSLSKIYGLENLNLGNYCFSGTSALSEIHVSSVEGFLNNIFNSTSSPFYASSAASRGLYINNTLVTNINIPNTFSSVPAFLFRGNNTLESVTFPSTITVIPVHAFYNCTALTSVNIPSSITQINESAFWGCLGLSSFPSLDNVENFGVNAFYDCRNIAGPLSLSNAVTIGNYAFRTNSYNVSPIDIGPNCTNIDTNAFVNVGSGTNKATFIIRATAPPTMANNVALGQPVYIDKVYVPSGTLSAYQSATNWSNYAGKMLELNPDGTIPI